MECRLLMILTFHFVGTGFFDEFERTQDLREPSQEEVNGLVRRTTDFYEDLFLMEFGGNFLEFQFLCKCLHALLWRDCYGGCFLSVAIVITHSER